MPYLVSVHDEAFQSNQGPLSFIYRNIKDAQDHVKRAKSIKSLEHQRINIIYIPGSNILRGNMRNFGYNDFRYSRM